ncbi:homocysteine methyltransferase [Leifsonia sp. ALI-44-B]|uniref:homocysteine S-methyltransferase family protein n=1 Tax=Leifsonia sp. ALI-44-B TaxID=1933776 RepID=UPI00097CB951|nr:homocysteine S-methyltransferase family protein [Leifsonia sp. ALI-44-B]ONI60554.1 homocysteine methyltransferase [Leifsonia sp. ALI-44-B]
MAPTSKLLQKLADGPVVVAEGYLFELERRGYVQAGAYVPEVVLEHPEKVAELHREFVRAGSDVVEAFTYYGHREKMRVIGKEHLLEPLNRDALRIATAIAAETGTIAAGNICNTNLYVGGDDAEDRFIRAIFDEQIGWAADAGVDYIVAETMAYAGEALIATKAIVDAGLTAVVTLAPHQTDLTREGWSFADAARRIEDAGASVIGLNCHRGLWTIMPLIEEIRAAVSVPVAALPVPYRTTDEHKTFQALEDPLAAAAGNGRAFPTALDPFTVNRYEVADWGRAAVAAGVDYVGLCCGAGPHHIRALAESIGRTPDGSVMSPDMTKHALFGDYEGIKAENQAHATRM